MKNTVFLVTHAKSEKIAFIDSNSSFVEIHIDEKDGVGYSFGSGSCKTGFSTISAKRF